MTENPRFRRIGLVVTLVILTLLPPKAAAHRAGTARAGTVPRHPIVHLSVPEGVTAVPGDYTVLPLHLHNEGDTGWVRVDLELPDDWYAVPELTRAVGTVPPGCEADGFQPGPWFKAGAGEQLVHFVTVAVPPTATPGWHGVRAHVEARSGCGANVSAVSRVEFVQIFVPAAAGLAVDRPPLVRIPAGSAGHVELRTFNMGNVPLAVNVSARLPAAWGRRAHGGPHETIFLEPGQASVARVTLHPPPNTTPGKIAVPVLFHAVGVDEWATLDPTRHRPSGPGHNSVRRSLTVEVEVLPPTPVHTPRLGPPMAAARVRVGWDMAAGPRPGEGHVTSRRWRFEASVPDGRARAGRLRIGWRTRRAVNVDGSLWELDELDLQTKRWQLWRGGLRARLTTLLSTPNDALTLRGQGWLVAASDRFALAREWNLGTSTVTLGYSTAGPDHPPAFGVDVHAALPGGSGGAFRRDSGWTLHLGAAVSGVAVARSVGLEWGHPQQVTPWRGKATAVWRDPGFSPAEPAHEYRLWLQRHDRTGFLGFWADVNGDRDGGRQEATLGIHGLRRLGVDTTGWRTEWDLRLRHRLPLDPSNDRAAATDVALQFRRSGPGPRLTLTQQWFAETPERWRTRLSWRRRVHRGLWWEAALVREAAYTERWQAELETGGSDGTHHWRARLQWLSGAPNVPGELHWRADVQRDDFPGWGWSFYVAGKHVLVGQGATSLTGDPGTTVYDEWQAGMELSYRFQLPLPVPSPQSQLEGTVAALPGTVAWPGVPRGGVAHAVVSLTGEGRRVLMTTDEAGRFRSPLLPPGRYRVQIDRLPPSLHDWVPVDDGVEVELRRGRVATVAVHVAPGGQIHGRILSQPESVPWVDPPQLRAHLIDGAGRPVADTPVEGNRFRFAGLVPGMYRVVVTDDRSPEGLLHLLTSGKVSVRTAPAVAVRAGEVTTVDVETVLRVASPRVTFVGEWTGTVKPVEDNDRRR